MIKKQNSIIFLNRSTEAKTQRRNGFKVLKIKDLQPRIYIQQIINQMCYEKYIFSYVWLQKLYLRCIICLKDTGYFIPQKQVT